MFNSVGIIGSGTVGRAIAHHALASGRAVRIASTKPVPELQSFLDSHQLHARAVELPEAASADLVVLAVPFVHVGDVGTAIGDWTGKVVVDATNQFATASPYQGRADTEGLTGSEWVAARLPGATVIKAFNAMFGAFIAADPRHAEGRQIVFLPPIPHRPRTPLLTWSMVSVSLRLTLGPWRTVGGSSNSAARSAASTPCGRANAGRPNRTPHCRGSGWR